MSLSVFGVQGFGGNRSDRTDRTDHAALLLTAIRPDETRNFWLSVRSGERKTMSLSHLTGIHPRPGGTTDVSRGIHPTGTPTPTKFVASRRSNQSARAYGNARSPEILRAPHGPSLTRRASGVVPFRGMNPTAIMKCPYGTGGTSDSMAASRNNPLWDQSHQFSSCRSDGAPIFQLSRKPLPRR
jgi:hypothetical protein